MVPTGKNLHSHAHGVLRKTNVSNIGKAPKNDSPGCSWGAFLGCSWDALGRSWAALGGS